MNFALTEEQSILSDMTRRFLSENYPFDSARRTGGEGVLWGRLHSELGLVGASFPEEIGGLGGGAVETMTIMEAFGEALLTEPYLETVVTCGSLLQTSGGAAAQAALSGIIHNGETLSFCHWEPAARHNPAHVSARAQADGDGWSISGAKGLVVGADVADRLIISARTSGEDDDVNGISLFLVEPDMPGLTLEPVRLLDGRQSADVSLASVTVGADALLGQPDAAGPAIFAALDRSAAALSAEAVGLLQAMLDQTVDYTRQRSQFGQPLSRFQALQHRMVDMLMQVEQARAAAILATLKLDDPAVEREQAVSAAKIVVNDALLFVGQNAVQLHGAMGLTDELAISHYFKRAMMIREQLGGTDHHVARYAANMRAAIAA